MIENKSDKFSEFHRAVGNNEFKKCEFYDALISYNKALCFAKSKKLKALAYANRSAVFIELHKYDECLKNIVWARDGYENIQKLNEREEKCKKLKASVVYDAEEDLFNFFKLSYPPNKNVPFIVDCLEVRTTSKYGRGIYTTRDLKAGDIIAIEKAELFCLQEGGKYCRCCSCGKSVMMNLIPCDKNASVMFCSPKCRDEVYKYVNNYEILITPDIIGRPDEKNLIHAEKILFDADRAFGGRENLLKFIAENDKKSMDQTVFSLNLSDANHPDYVKNFYKSIMALGTTTDHKSARNISRSAEVHSKGNRLIKKFLTLLSVVALEQAKKHCYVLRGGNILFHRICEGLMVRGFSSLINHSCEANVQTVDTDDLTSIVYCRRPIKAGEQIFYNYLADEVYTPREDRRALLKKASRFFCDCYNCLKNIDIEATYPSKPNPIIEATLQKGTKIANFSVGKSRKEVFDQIRENFELLNRYCEEHPTRECIDLMNVTYTMIHCLAMQMTFPCIKEKWMETPFLDWT